MANLEFARHSVDGVGSIDEQSLLLRWRHQAEKCAWLRVVIGILTVIPVIGCSFD